MTAKVKVGQRGQVVIPKKLREKHKIEMGVILEIEDTKDGLILKPYNPVKEMKGIGKGIFGDSVKYQKKIREEWDRKDENRSRH
jgi:AbrB family looped-hinge helix DNA binding protein